MKIGILKEGRTPQEKRVVITPAQCKQVFEKYPQIQIVVQPSPVRCFMDEEYEDAGIPMQFDLSDCDVLLGVKEVPVEELIPGKTFLFFSHTVKKQEYNKELLKTILEKKITLIDYELIKDEEGNRKVGFGRWAGIVGTYNGFRAYAIRNKLKEPTPAHLTKGIKEVKKEAKKLALGPMKILITGGGRVAKGAMELLDGMGVSKVSTEEYLKNKDFDRPVYAQVEPGAYNKHKDGKPFNIQHFYEHPKEYIGDFKKFCHSTDMLIAAAYWDINAPVLFTREEMKEDGFRIKIIADITCDMNGSVPSTLRPSTIDDPFYGYNPFTGQEELAFVYPRNISVMAVDNLPCELPVDASIDFGNIFIEQVLPFIVEGNDNGILERATITRNGQLMEKFRFLEGWINP